MWAAYVIATGPYEMLPRARAGMYSNTWLWTLEFTSTFWVRAR